MSTDTTARAATLAYLALGLALGLGLTLAFGTARAQLGNFKMDPEPPAPRTIDEPDPWSEARIPLPPWPEDADLIEVDPDGGDRAFRYFVDGANLRAGADGVVRYTLVVETAGGFRNVSYEGIRCTVQGRFKIYAYGAPDGSGGTFTRIPGAEWQALPRSSSLAYAEDLFRHRFCVPREGRPRTERDILRALGDRGRAEHSTGFQAD